MKRPLLYPLTDNNHTFIINQTSTSIYIPIIIINKTSTSIYIPIVIIKKQAHLFTFQSLLSLKKPNQINVMLFHCLHACFFVRILCLLSAACPRDELRILLKDSP